MKTLIEEITGKSNFDSKNITNKSNKIIGVEDLNYIENNGATLEYLEKLNVPVFYYQTQITIHGLFPELGNNYFAGYKTLFQNKNLSIGVKHIAIDFDKKKKVYNYLNELMGFYIDRNSTKYCAYLSSKRFDTLAEAKAYYLDVMKPKFEHINKDLFYGSAGFQIWNIYGSYTIEFYFNISAIKENNVIPLIENIFNKKIAVLDEEIRTKRELKEAEYKRIQDEYKVKQIALVASQKPIIELAKNDLLSAGYVFMNEIGITNNLIAVKLEVDEDLKTRFICKKFVKSKQQKQFRYYKCYDFKNLDFNEKTRPEKTILLKLRNVYILPIKQSEIAIQDIKKEVVNKVTAKDIKLVNYSAKAVAVVGDTKPIKEQLKNLGGKFNFRLTCGAGWIFPKTKENNIKLLLNL